MSERPQLSVIVRGRVRAEVRRVGGREQLVMRVPEVSHLLPVDREGRVVLVSQWRPAVGRFMLEAPAGGVEAGETPGDAARRELAEETGLRAGRLIHCGSFATCPGITDEVAHLFIATGCEPHPAPPRPDADERITVVRMPLAELLDHRAGGQADDDEGDDLLDAKTFLLAQIAAQLPAGALTPKA